MKDKNLDSLSSQPTKEGRWTSHLAKQAARLHRCVTDLVIIYQGCDRNTLVCHSLTVSQFYALEALDQGPIFMSDLASRLHVAKSTATRLIDRLVARRFVQRQNQTQDRRSVEIRLTEKGATTLQTIQSEITERNRKILESLPKESRDDAMAALKQLARIINNQQMHR